MELFIETQEGGKELHHAYCIEGEREIVVAALKSFLERSLGIRTHGNPDFWYGVFDGFTIDDSRALKAAHSRKAFDGGKKFFLIAANHLTHEAQNALLKVFEDPTPQTHFFLIMPTSSALLPTLLSRLALYHYQEGEKAAHPLVSDFLSAAPPERLILIKKMAEEKDKAEALDFVNALEVSLKKKSATPPTSGEIFVFEELMKCRGYLLGRSPSVKMILEYLSLAIPQHSR